MSLYRITTRCSYILDGRAVVHRTGDDLVELPDEIAESLGDAAELIARRNEEPETGKAPPVDEPLDGEADEQGGEDDRVEVPPAAVATDKPKRGKSKRAESAEGGDGDADRPTLSGERADPEATA